MTRRALLTGITGQDGSYLAELLLSKGYEVAGLVRPDSLAAPEHLQRKIPQLLGKVTLHSAHLEDRARLHELLALTRPDECYHLAGVSVMSYSFDDEFATLQTNTNPTHHLLSGIKLHAPECRFFLAASSELFGRTTLPPPQTETTPFRPRGPYGIAKQASFEIVRLYREAHGLHASTGILYNHESPRRGLQFVTRKITRHAAMIRLGLATELTLGDTSARRDWSHARDFVRAMWMMTTAPTADDYILSSGVLRTVDDLCQTAFSAVGLDHRQFVRTDPKFHRPPETAVLQGDNTKAKTKLGWTPEIPFEELVKEMVQADLADLKQQP